MVRCVVSLFVSATLAGVTVASDDRLHVGDTTFEVVATVKVAEAPHGMCFSPDGRLVYVACAGGDRITVIDAVTHEMVCVVAAGHVPLDVIPAPTGHALLATQFRGEAVLRIPLDGGPPVNHLTLKAGPSLFSPPTTRGRRYR